MTASIGQPIQRTESIAKVTGRARYAAEQPQAVGQLYAWYVPATVPAGTVERVELDDDPTVHAIIWHGNAETLGEVEDAELHVLQSNTVAYRGQIVAVVVADTLQDARAAATRVRVQYTDVRSPDNTLTAEHGSLYAGSPETVARKIAATAQTLGLDRFDLKYSNGPMPHEQLMTSIELYGTQVIPLVREMLA